MSPLGQTISRCASARYRGCRRLLVLALIVPLILALAAIWAFPVLAQTSPLFYRTDYPLDYGLEGGTSGLVIADFNNDGKLDFAVGAGYGIDIALGNGDGTFKPFTSFVPSGGGLNGSAALSSAAADIDGDGNIDLILYFASGVVLLPGKGDGTFGPGRLITSQEILSESSGSDVLQAADLNHDGHPDLVYVTYAGGSPIVGSAVVLLNNGDGTFTSRTAFKLPNNEYALGVAIADFNHDGTLDLAVTSLIFSGYGPPPAVVGHVYLGLGRGDGSFSSPVAVATLNQTPSFIAAGDFNHDGVPDLAVESGMTSIFINNGDGSFRSAPTLNVCCAATGSIAVADWTGTGNPGLGIVSAVTPQGIAIFGGNGDGTFYATGTAAVNDGAEYVYQFFSADLNGDGRPDLVAQVLDAGNFPPYRYF